MSDGTGSRISASNIKGATTGVLHFSVNAPAFCDYSKATPRGEW